MVQRFFILAYSLSIWSLIYRSVAILYENTLRNSTTGNSVTLSHDVRYVSDTTSIILICQYFELYVWRLSNSSSASVSRPGILSDPWSMSSPNIPG